jgi:hypothetical protein
MIHHESEESAPVSGTGFGRGASGRNWLEPRDQVWVVVETNWQYDDEQTWFIGTPLGEGYYLDEGAARAACRRLCQSVASPASALESAANEQHGEPDPVELLRGLLQECHHSAPYTVLQVELNLVQTGSRVPWRWPLDP